ncbi:MAG: tRNA (adenosine(37)-N6)-threonylcarbamoyltransferase complex ATPase subunit type 1 TsaE, partial [Hyphomicrobiales bacterium]
VQPYDTPAGPVLHADLYRLGDPAEADELGLLDNALAIVLVEWAERAAHVADAATIVIALAIPPGGVGRALTLIRR